jgi:hypothetical protein
MKTILLGLPYFAKKTAQNLSEFDKDNEYLAIEMTGSIKSILKYIKEIFSADRVYRIGGSTKCGGALRLAKILRKQIILHWVGTDVMNACAAYRSGQFDHALIQESMHFCNAEWLNRELHTIGINAQIVYLPFMESKPPAPPPLPREFSILTYIGKGREKFYGIDKLIALANRYPHIPIKVTTLAEYGEKLPPNIHLLGFVQDMIDEMLDCTLLLRLPEHDGQAFTVLEALSLGRYVCFIYDYVGVITVANNEELFSAVDNLYKKHMQGSLQLNVDGYNYVMSNFANEIVMKRMVSAFGYKNA